MLNLPELAHHKAYGGKMSSIDIPQFKKILNQLEGLHQEISALSKKSASDALNAFKLKLVNQVIDETNKILGNQYKPFPDFDHFDDDELPSNSDVALVLSQYVNSMESLREENIKLKVEYDNRTYWIWIGTEIQTYPPKNIKK